MFARMNLDEELEMGGISYDFSKKSALGIDSRGVPWYHSSLPLGLQSKRRDRESEHFESCISTSGTRIKRDVDTI